MRAERPITKVDFVNLQPEVVPDAPAPQPDNQELAKVGAIALDELVIACSRALVDETLRNPGVFSSADLVDQGNVRPLIPLAIDPPDHLRYRKLLDPLFAPRQIDRLDADITMRVNHFIDQFESRGSCNFTAEFAELFPSAVFLGLMGLAWSELDTLVELRDGILRPGDSDWAPEARTALQKATAERVYAYFDAVLDTRTTAPGDDILSALTREDLTRHEMLDICFVLLTAGLDTVTDSLTCFWAFLAQNADHRRQITTDPEVIPDAVEELLRWESPVPAVIRWAREDHHIGEHPVNAGHLVMASLSAANVDPDEYPDAMVVRFDRETNRHLAFGGGIHRCLGSHLARRELRIALREWHRRIPEYELAPGYRPAYKPPLRFVPDLQLVWS
jgi:cytochrome P450